MKLNLFMFVKTEEVMTGMRDGLNGRRMCTHVCHYDKNTLLQPFLVQQSAQLQKLHNKTQL